MDFTITFQSGDIVTYLLVAIAGVLLYSSRTFVDLFVRRLTCKVFKHDFEKKTIANMDYLHCARCQIIDHDFSRFRQKQE